MPTVRQSIEVAVPLATAYNQWTQFEEFPRFMEGVDEVRQLDDTHLRWAATVAGARHEWNAEITEQLPEQRIAWRATAGVEHTGEVTFARAGDGARIDVAITFDPPAGAGADFQPGAGEGAFVDVLGIAERRIAADLERFREMIEGRGVETGGWRGKVADGETTSGAGG